MFAVNQQLNNMYYKYDREHDVLHLYFGKPTISYADEIVPGIFIRLSNENDSITGIIILDYKKRVLDGNKKLQIPINIDFKEINEKILQ